VSKKEESIKGITLMKDITSKNCKIIVEEEEKLMKSPFSMIVMNHR
jgi:hypothetical protein